MAEYRNLKGGKELQDFLNQLPAKIEQNVMRSALRAGAKVIADEAKVRVPVGDSGLLRDSIRVSTRARKGRVSASAKAGDKKAFYWRWVEYGTAAHEIRPKNGKSLFFSGLFSELIDHPGARAKPFMRPAFDNKANEAIQAVGRMIGKRLNKAGLNAPDGFKDDEE